MKIIPRATRPATRDEIRRAAKGEVIVGGMHRTHFHKNGCSRTTNLRRARPWPLAFARAMGLQPCSFCRPEGE